MPSTRWPTPPPTAGTVLGLGRGPIYAQRLAGDGLSVVGKRHELLHPSDKIDYESLIEGAWMVRHGRYHYLLYSGDACCFEEAHYAVGVARATSPLGPFTRSPDNPILARNAAFWAPATTPWSPTPPAR